MRGLLLLAVMMLAYAEPAGAVTLVTPDGQVAPEPWQGWAQSMRVPPPSGTIELYVGTPCPGGPDPNGTPINCAAPAIYGRPPRIYMAPTPTYSADIFRHELGHVFDVTTMTDARRGIFMWLIGIGGPWAQASSPSAANEVFARTYSLCARLRRMRPKWEARNLLPWQPRRQEYGRACAFIRRVGGWYMRA